MTSENLICVAVGIIIGRVIGALHLRLSLWLRARQLRDNVRIPRIPIIKP